MLLHCPVMTGALLLPIALWLLPLAAGAAPAEDVLKGVWKDTERGMQVALERDSAGLWFGKVVAAQRKEELGKRIFRGLRFDPATGTYIGKMFKPDDDEEVSVTLRLTSDRRLEAVASKFFLSKTLWFDRQDAGADGGPR